MGWLFVLNEAEALEWVLERGLLAVRDSVQVEQVRRGDDVALYATRGAFHNPTRNEATIVALGSVTGAARFGAWTVLGEQFTKAVPFAVSALCPLRSGLPFRPLVDRLEFIRKKESWGAYLRRSVVRLAPKDWRTIATEFARHHGAL